MIRPVQWLSALALLAAASCGEAPGPAAVPTAPAAAAPWSAPRRILFLHRSVGTVLIRDGEIGMYDVLGSLNAEHGTAVEMWHHGWGTSPYWNRYYDGADQQVEPNFGPATSEPLYANPEHWRRVFGDDAPPYAAARDSIDGFRVVAFKSGYDNTVQHAAERAGRWRRTYRQISRTAFVADPGRRFVLLGFPPTRRGLGPSTQADADSARAFNDWLVREFARGRGNLFAFPLFDRLAGPDNWLRDEYERVDSPYDAHPNAYGCEVVGRELMTYLYEVAVRDRPPPPEARPPHAAAFP